MYCCYWLSLDASNLTQGPLGVLNWKKWKLCYICYHVVSSFTYASLTGSLIYYYYCCWFPLDASTLTKGPLGVLSWKKWKLCFYFILHCHSCTYVFLVLLLLLFTVLGCFNINTRTFGSVKLKEMKIMLYMLPCSFLLYVC